MSPDLLPPVFALWRELTRISAGDLDGGCRLVVERLGALIDAQRGYTLVGAVDRGTWRPLRRLPSASEHDVQRVDSLPAIRDAFAADLAAGAGGVRVVCVREQAGREPSAGCEAAEERTVDCLCLVLPVGPKAEVAFAFERRGEALRFSGKDREVALLCAPGLSRTARWAVLAYGDSVGGRPLGDRERKVLVNLLSGATEKQAADSLATTLGALHQTVVGIYRKLGVRSRPELMALWCGDLAGSSIEKAEASLVWKDVHHYRTRPLSK